MRGRVLDYDVIKRATQGDEFAIADVLKHFEGYIRVLSRRRIYDDRGNDISPCPEETENRLKGKLAFAVKKFDPERIV